MAHEDSPSDGEGQWWLDRMLRDMQAKYRRAARNVPPAPRPPKATARPPRTPLRMREAREAFAQYTAVGRHLNEWGERRPYRTIAGELGIPYPTLRRWMMKHSEVAK